MREIPIKLLDENRRWINRHFAERGHGKSSYTHFIAWAMIKALAKYPQMNDGYEEADGTAYRLRRAEVNLGVAVDVIKKDGSRTLLVPSVKGANRMTFSQFLDAYQDVVTRAREGKLQVSDFQGTTISITNPGTLGTSASSPRLMAGQGAIIATGAIEFPPEFTAMTPAALSQLGISKVFTITSTYDHRIIQGAESGGYLAFIHELFHVVFDWPEIQQKTYHLSDEENDLFVLKHKEEEANEFARDYLFPKAKMDLISKRIDQKMLVREFALGNHVHPSIVYSNYAFVYTNDQSNYWAIFDKLIRPPMGTLKKNLVDGLTHSASVAKFAAFYRNNIFNQTIFIKTANAGNNS